MAERPAYGWDGGNQMLDDLADQEQEQKEKEKRDGFSAADELKDLNEDGSDPEAQSPIEAAPPEAPTAPADHIPSAELPEEDGHERLAPDGAGVDEETPPGGEGPKVEKPKDGAESHGEGGDKEFDPIRVSVGDIDKAIDSLARRMAHEKIIETAHQGSAPKMLMRAIWRGTIGREYDRQKYLKEARDKIMESGAPNLLANREKTTLDDNQREINSIFERLQEIVVRDGERYEEMADTEANSAFKTGMKELLREYATNPEMSTEALREGKTRLLAEIQEEHPDFIEGAEGLADNIETAAEQVRAAAEHAESLDRLLDSIEFYEAEIRHGSLTEVDPTVCDRIIEKINSTKIGKYVSETTVASAVAIAYNGAQMVGARGLGTAMGMIAPGAAGGLVAGMREGAIFRGERQFHLGERAMGADLPEGKRRAEMEETRYETIDAVSSAGKLRDLLAIEHRSPEQQAELAKAVSEIHVRQVFGDERNVDLVGYSSPETAETERLELYRAVAASIQELSDWGATASPEELAAIGAGDSMEDILASMREAKTIELNAHVGEKDKVYKKLRWQAIGKAVAKGTLIGVAVGTVVQEGVAFASESKQGAVESLVNGGGSKSGEAHRTALASLFGVERGGGAGKGTSSFHFERLKNGELVKLSDGTLIKHTENGMDLMQGDKVLVENIEIGKGGALSESSKAALQEQGILDIKRLIITHEHKKAVVSTRIGEYLSEHPKSTQRVERNLFMDNNTRVFDRNELRLWWGDGGGVDSKGNYVLDVTHMEPNGSFHDGLSVNAKELAEQGKLKLLISPDEAHQHKPFEVPINSDGRAVIDKDSAVAKSMFSKNGGRAISRARFVEVAQTLGESRGREQVNILATLEGKGVGSIRHEVDKIVPEVRTGLVISAPEAVVGGTDYPPIIPVTPRRELEPLEAAPTPIELDVDYMKMLSEKELAEYRSRISERLKENPDADLDPALETSEYLDRLTPTEKKLIQQLEIQIEEKPSEKCELVIAIPVAGHEEADNIYSTLEAYLGQDADAEKYEIVLFVNHPIKKGPDGKEYSSDATMAEIERFKKDHPELPVRVAQAGIPESQARLAFVRKLLTDMVLDRHKATIESGKDLIVVSNDADLAGLGSKKYISNFIEKLSNPDLDAILGQIDWDPRAYAINPLVHISTRFFQYTEAQARKDPLKMGSSGANFAFKASAYSAVGGYPDMEGAGEDVYFGRSLKAARQGSKKKVAIGWGGTVKSKVYTSARRSVDAVRNGIAPYEQWGDGFGIENEEVRTMPLSEQGKEIDYDDPEQLAEFQSELEYLLNRTIRKMVSWGASTGSTEKGASDIDRALSHLGVEYEWNETGDQIKVTDTSKLVEGLKKYEDEGLKIFKSRVER